MTHKYNLLTFTTAAIFYKEIMWRLFFFNSLRQVTITNFELKNIGQNYATTDIIIILLLLLSFLKVIETVKSVNRENQETISQDASQKQTVEGRYLFVNLRN